MNLDNAVLRLEHAATRLYPDGWQRPLARDYNISQSQLSKWVNGKRDLNSRSRDRLAGLLLEIEQKVNDLHTETALAVANVINFNKEPVTLRGKITERFEIIDDLVAGVIAGTVRSVIVTGSQGLGKSFGTMKQLRASGKPYVTITGTAGPFGAYRILFENRNNTVLFDDCDKLLRDEDFLNILKGATNTDDSYRRVTWGKMNASVYQGTDEERLAEIAHLNAEIAELKADDATVNARRIEILRDKVAKLETKVPRAFDFNGGVIFITNKDLSAMIEEESPLQEHYLAIIDRGFLMPLGLDTNEAKVERVAQGIEEFGLLDKCDIDRKTEGAEIVTFMRENADNFQSISFRTAEKIAILF